MQLVVVCNLQITPVYISPALNERNFGDLQGVPSTKHTVLFDKEQIRKIRNDYNTKFPGVNGESCADVHARAIPFFEDFILPHLQAGRNVLLSSHGFVIRTLVKYLDNMDEREFNEQMKLEKSAPERCLLLAPTGTSFETHVNRLIGRSTDHRLTASLSVCCLCDVSGVPLMYKYENGAFTKVAQSRRDRAESLSRSSAPY